MSSHKAPGTPDGVAPDPDIDFQKAQVSPAFSQLRKDHRSFIFPMAVAFLIWYLLYVVCAIYAPGFMSSKVIGNINIGVIFGLLQFVTTFLITAAYVSYANKKLDPQASALRDDMEAGVYSAGVER